MKMKRINEKGVVLIVTFVFMTAISMAILAFLSMKAVQIRASGYRTSSNKAFWLAEAGLEEYKYLLKTSSTYRNVYPDLSENLGEGAYLVQAIYDGDKTYTLTSGGTVNTITREVVQSVEVVEDFIDGFDYSFYSGGNMEFNSVDITVNGDMAAADNIWENSTDIDITGDMTPDTPLPPISVDFASYEAIADNVRNGYTEFSGGQTYNGIWYIDGDVWVDGDNITINGTIVATGFIYFNSVTNSTVASSGNYPALVAGDSIYFNSFEDSIVNGLVFTENRIECNSVKYVDFTGAIVSNGDAEINSVTDVTITHDPNLTINPPPFFSQSGGGDVVVTPNLDWYEQ